MIDDDTLTLYYYDDGLSTEERRRVEKVLSQDTELALRYRALRLRLEQWRELAGESAPEYLVQRWHDSIDSAARAESAKTRKTGSTVHFMSFVWGALVTAALVLGIGIGVYFSGSQSGPLPDDERMANRSFPENGATPGSFTRGLQVHLRQSQWELAELPVGDAANRALLLMQIIEQNRTFERVATQNQSHKVARLLRAFEPILLQLANEDIAPEDAEALRAQLAFELSVLLTKLTQETSEEEHST